MLIEPDKYRRIGITGHRPDKLGREYNYDGPYSKYIHDSLMELIRKYEPECMISGMALGVDTIFAKIAFELNIPLVAAVPFEGQEAHWPYESQILYRHLMSNPLVIKRVVSPGDFTHKKMQLRNEYVVNNCDLLISVFDGTPGGTANCVAYAESINHKIINIDPRLAIQDAVS